MPQWHGNTHTSEQGVHLSVFLAAGSFSWIRKTACPVQTHLYIEALSHTHTCTEPHDRSHYSHCGRLQTSSYSKASFHVYITAVSSRCGWRADVESRCEPSKNNCKGTVYEPRGAVHFIPLWLTPLLFALHLWSPSIFLCQLPLFSPILCSLFSCLCSLSISTFQPAKK